MFISDSLLRRHVRESNLIEGITATPDMPAFKCHLAAARIAASGMIVPPNQLHELLTRQLIGFGTAKGEYRKVGVAVGEQRMPHWSEVPRLMEEWENLTKEYLASEKDLEYSAFFLHAWLLCIHPWVDGNGRTSRLVWNMYRVRRELPWIVQSAHSKREYYWQIRKVEKVFKMKYPSVYY